MKSISPQYRPVPLLYGMREAGAQVQDLAGWGFVETGDVVRGQSMRSDPREEGITIEMRHQ